MSEYQKRICIKCGKPFQEHFTMGSRALCPNCFFEKPELEGDKGVEGGAGAMSDSYDDLRKATPEELLAAIQWAFSDASPNFMKGLEIGFKIAREGGWEQVAPGWLRRSKEEKKEQEP